MTSATNNLMSTAPIQFEKIWIDQCQAAEGILGQFGLQNALDYLIGEKLFNFVQASEQRPEFAAELPLFVVEIRRLFTARADSWLSRSPGAEQVSCPTRAGSGIR